MFSKARLFACVFVLLNSSYAYSQDCPAEPVSKPYEVIENCNNEHLLEALLRERFSHITEYRPSSAAAFETIVATVLTRYRQYGVVNYSDYGAKISIEVSGSCQAGFHIEGVHATGSGDNRQSKSLTVSSYPRSIELKSRQYWNQPRPADSYFGRWSKDEFGVIVEHHDTASTNGGLNKESTGSSAIRRCFHNQIYYLGTNDRVSQSGTGSWDPSWYYSSSNSCFLKNLAGSVIHNFSTAETSSSDILSLCPLASTQVNCQIETVGDCTTNDKYSNTLFIDDYGATHFGSGHYKEKCLARAENYYKWCNNSQLEVSATWMPTGDSRIFNSVAGGSSGPSNLKASAISSGKITLSWVLPSGLKSTDKIELSKNSTHGWWKIPSVYKSVSEIPASSGDVFKLRIRYADGTLSQFSNSVTAGGGSTGSSTTQEPTVAQGSGPSHLKASAVSGGKVTLSWVLPSGLETTDMIELSRNDRNGWWKIPSVYKTVSGVPASSGDVFKLRIRYADGTLSPFSNSVIVGSSSTTVQEPTVVQSSGVSNLVATSILNGKVTLSWDLPSGLKITDKIEISRNDRHGWWKISSVYETVSQIPATSGDVFRLRIKYSDGTFSPFSNSVTVRN